MRTSTHPRESCRNTCSPASGGLQALAGCRRCMTQAVRTRARAAHGEPCTPSGRRLSRSRRRVAFMTSDEMQVLTRDGGREWRVEFLDGRLMVDWSYEYIAGPAEARAMAALG